MFKKYLKPTSLTWLASVGLGVVQAVRLAGIEIPTEVDKILASLAAIGLRGAMKD